jgi:hypothetical protein
LKRRNAMKREIKEQRHIVVPKSTAELLDKACEADPINLKLGQMVTKLAREAFPHLAEPQAATARQGVEA